MIFGEQNFASGFPSGAPFSTGEIVVLGWFRTD